MTPDYIQPVFMFANKDYKQMLTTQEEANAFFHAISKMAELMSKGEISYTLQDDMLIWFRSFFWLRDPKFIEAMREFEDDVTLRARMWRLYNLCWALSQAAYAEGDVVDVGCYEAKSSHVFCKYNEDVIWDKRVYLFDYFDAPPGDHKKIKHGPELAKTVAKRMKEYHPVVAEGSVMDTIPKQLPDKICFAHIDLNGHEAEAHVMPEIYSRMSKGAILIFDDYGFSRYRESGLVHQKFLENKCEKILELPTGQGMMVKL